MFNYIYKLFFIVFLFYQSSLYSKSTSFNNFDSKDLSNYFSGIVAFENKKNSEALKFFNSSRVLLEQHDPYLKIRVYLNAYLKFVYIYEMNVVQ